MTGSALCSAAQTTVGRHAHSAHLGQPSATPVSEPTAHRSVMDAWLRKLRLHGDTHSRRRDSRGSSSSSSALVNSSSSNNNNKNNSGATIAACDAMHKRKQPSFIKALFHPHELKAIGSSARADAGDSATSESRRRRRGHASESDNQASESQPQLPSSSSHPHPHPQQQQQDAADERALGQSKQQQREAGRPQQPWVAAPVEIPSTYMGRAFDGAMTVGGRRVPFTRDAHRRSRKKRVRALAQIAETHALAAPGSSSMQAYRSRAYYAGPAGAKSSSKSSSARKDKR